MESEQDEVFAPQLFTVAFGLHPKSALVLVPEGFIRSKHR